MIRKFFACITAAAMVFTAACGFYVSADNSITYTFMSLPDIDTSFKTYMDYSAITNKRSVQYKMQQEAYTDEDGIRRIDDYVCIAVGTGYSNSCGDKYIVELASGNSFYAIVGDIKADKHTDSTNRYHKINNKLGDVIEFIVDTDKLDRKVRRSGNIGTYEKYSGEITALIKVEENF